MKVIIKSDQYYYTDDEFGGNLVSTIYIDIDTKYFPCKNWTDFTSEIISGWIWELHNLLLNKGDNAHLYFMEGPYYMKASKTIYKKNIYLDLDFIDCDKIIYRKRLLAKDVVVPIIEAYNNLRNMEMWQRYKNKESREFEKKTKRLLNYVLYGKTIDLYDK